MGPLIKGILEAGSSKEEFNTMGLCCLLYGLAAIAIIAGTIICHIPRFEDTGRGILLFGPVLIAISIPLGMRAW